MNGKSKLVVVVKWSDKVGGLRSVVKIYEVIFKD